MGLFDGAAAPAGRSGATADLARYLRLRSFLVRMFTVSPIQWQRLCAGSASHDPAVRIAGVFLSDRQRSPRALIAEALAPLAIPVVGVLPRDQHIALPERHLGLVQAVSTVIRADGWICLAELAASNFDLDRIAHWPRR